MEVQPLLLAAPGDAAGSLPLPLECGRRVLPLNPAAAVGRGSCCRPAHFTALHSSRASYCKRRSGKYGHWPAAQHLQQMSGCAVTTSFLRPQERGEETEGLVETRWAFAPGRLCRITCAAGALALPGDQEVLPFSCAI